MKESLLTILLVLAGCTAAAPSPQPLPCPATGLPLPPLAVGETRAQPKAFLSPPLPPPVSVRGARAVVRVLVDTTGTAVSDSIVVCGVRDASYAALLARSIAQLPFEPAWHAGERVRGYAFISYAF